MSIRFEDNSGKIKEEMRQEMLAWLHEAAGELEAQVRRNQRVATGKTKGSWRYIIDTEKLEGMIGSDSENAIWEEFGTGEYALSGNGRKGGWYYVDAFGKRHFTRGKRPNRALYNAYVILKDKLIARAREFIGRMNG